MTEYLFARTTDVDAVTVTAAKIAAQAAAAAAVISASTASSAATAAQTAQGLAETAQGLAEAAQLAAENAQTAAEAAQTGAETAQGLAEAARDAAIVAQLASEAAAASALQNIVEDLTPQLGGALDMNGQGIAGSMTTFNVAAVTDATTRVDLFRIEPSDYGTNKPSFSIVKGTNAEHWEIALWDGVDTNGLLNFLVSDLQQNGNKIWTAADFSASDFATAAQGATADTALQAAAIGVSLQAYDADLDAWAAVNPSSYYTSSQADTAIGSAISALSSVYQPLDGDLTSIAALSTTSFGRSVLEAADAAGLFATIKQAATTSATGVVEKAVDSEVRAATADKYIAADHIESASALVALTDAAPVAVDWDSGINFSLTVTTDRQIGNPTNGQPGTWRTIRVQGNNTTDRAITFGSQFGTGKPTITDCDSTKIYLLMIYCVTSSVFIVSAIDGSGP